MRVVIVAKTRMGRGACVGALGFDGRSLRLVAADAETNEQFNLEYNVGDVWDVDYTPDDDTPPPHTENIIVHDKRKCPPINDTVAFIERRMPPREGGLEELYDGLTQATRTGALFIAERTGVPNYSTMFWRPDQPLVRDDDAKRIRYRYPTADGGRTLTFVGFQEPLAQLPAGALLRVSLAHWWRPREMPAEELRCYAQLSGWFLPHSHTHASEIVTEAESADAGPPKPLPAPSLPPTPASARRLLKQVFGFDSFRSLQENVIDNVLQGRDTLAIMPTGSGKSLCYQLPALLFPGLTVVVSPLISLMQDQVDQMQELGITAVTLNSTLSYGQYQYTTTQLRNGGVDLLYVAPETLLRPETLALLEQCRVDCLTIDEAHCISEWGHDFRPEYRQLIDVRRRLPQAVCVAATATATERVRRDIKTALDVSAANTFIASFNRENLFLAVEPKTDGLVQTLAFLDGRQEESGIIYCATRRQVDTLTAQLDARGYEALPYHAGLDDETRRRHQRRFVHDEVGIMVATIAFGMGINKSNVRFILHYDLPKNLESYYQQIGRAGRDGLRADCLLLFSYGDVQTINYFIQQQDESQQQGATMRLQALLRFAESNQCRRRPLLDYFGEPYEEENCGACDNCTQDEEDLVDLTVPAQKFLSCVKRTGERFGVNYVIRVLRGSKARRVLRNGHDRLSTYDIGGEFSKKEWQYLARQFIRLGLLDQDMEYGGLSLTAKAYEVFKGEPVYGTLPDRPKRVTTPQPEAEHDRDLFDLLRDKRTALAQANDVPPYVIFSDRSLVEMAAYFPQSKASFAQIYGVGEAKLANYAGEFLPIIRDYCEANEIEEKARPATTATTPSRQTAVSSRTEEVATAYNSGRSIPELAADLGIKETTVLGHLWKWAREERPLRAGSFLELSQLPANDQQRVLDAYAELGTDFLRPVYDALEESVSYDELKILRLHYLASRENNLPQSAQSPQR